MSKQNKMSIKQVVKNEYKLVIFLTALALMLPLLSEFLMISDMSKFSNLTALEKLNVIIGTSEFEITNVNPIIYTGFILNIIMAPVYASIIGAKLKGNSLIGAISEGIKNIGTSKFWKYVVMVYLPYVAIILCLSIGVYFIPETTMLNFVTNVIESMPLLVVVVILLVVVSILLSTISAYIFVANSVYMRDDVELKQVFRAIPTRELNKIILFYFIDLVTSVLLIIGFIAFLGSMQPLTLLASIFTIAINIILILIIKQVIFGFATYVLFINVTSKVDTSNNYTNIEQNQAITQNQTTSQTENISQTTVTEVNSTSNANIFESNVKPKKSKRKNRINKEEVKVKPKRSIK